MTTEVTGTDHLNFAGDLLAQAEYLFPQVVSGYSVLETIMHKNLDAPTVQELAGHESLMLDLIGALQAYNRQVRELRREADNE